MRAAVVETMPGTPTIHDVDIDDVPATLTELAAGQVLGRAVIVL